MSDLTDPMLVRCIYCNADVPTASLTDEHIWPDALGGDELGPFWRTRVCRRCNNISGIYVDGAFIRSWFGTAERATDFDAYLSPAEPQRARRTFQYLGTIPNFGDPQIIVDYWVGPCGVHVMHFRPANEIELWDKYAGGDPRNANRQAEAGVAYLAMTSSVLFWQQVAIASFHHQFSKAKRYCITVVDPVLADKVDVPCLGDPLIDAQLAFCEATLRADKVQVRATIDTSLGGRFQAKLALALGYGLFGAVFGSTTYAGTLRGAFREGDPSKLHAMSVRGSGFLAQTTFGGAEQFLRWKGGWVLLLKRLGGDITLSIFSPSAKPMVVLVCDDEKLSCKLGPEYDDGLIWVTVPPIARAIGPIEFPAFLAHKLGNMSHPGLAELEAKIIDPALLPDCGL